MANFSDRLCQYPLVKDSLKATSDAYCWISSGETFRSIFQLSESAASAFKEKAKAFANTGSVAKLDDIACHHILDRLETVIPSVNKPTEDLLGPAADCALSAAESYIEHFLPDTKSIIDNKAITTRYDRLMRLQSALTNSDKVQAAQDTILKAYEGIQEQIVALSTVASKEKRKAMLCNIRNFATEYKEAAEMAFPSFKAFVTGAVSQLNHFTHDLLNVDHVTQIAIDQLQATVNGLHHTLLSVDEYRDKWLHGLIKSAVETDAKETEVD